MAKKKGEVKKDALTLPTYTEKVTGLVRLNLNAFDPSVRKEIASLLSQAGEAYSSIARSHLRIGEILSKARMILEGRGERIFVAFLNEIPGMSTATAYRYINAWDHARTVFPEAILTKILAANLPMLGGPDQKFGKYTDAVTKKNLDRELDKAVKNGKVDEAYAENWIKRVQVAYTEEHQKARGKGAKVPDPTQLQQEAYTAVRRRYLKLPKGKKTISWLSNLFAYVLAASGVGSPVTIDPRKPPKDWDGQPQEEEKKVSEEAKNGKHEEPQASA